MARPKPDTYDYYLTESHKHLITSCEGVFAILYAGKPFNLRIDNLLADAPSNYKKTTFVNKGHAHRHAMLLNEKFNTNQFTVVQLL